MYMTKMSYYILCKTELNCLSYLYLDSSYGWICISIGFDRSTLKTRMKENWFEFQFIQYDKVDVLCCYYCCFSKTRLNKLDNWSQINDIFRVFENLFNASWMKNSLVVHVFLPSFLNEERVRRRCS